MIDAGKLRKCSTDVGMPAMSVHVLNEDYVLPEVSWMTDDLGRALDKFYFNSGIEWRADQWECDAYSLMAVAAAKLSWARTVKREASIAVGLFGYLSAGHVLTIACHRNTEGNLYLAWYEPQPAVAENTEAFQLVCMLPVNLSAEDIQSCSCCWWF